MRAYLALIALASTGFIANFLTAQEVPLQPVELQVEPEPVQAVDAIPRSLPDGSEKEVEPRTASVPAQNQTGPVPVTVFERTEKDLTFEELGILLPPPAVMGFHRNAEEGYEQDERYGTRPAQAADPEPAVPHSELLAKALAIEQQARLKQKKIKPAELVALYRKVVEAEPNNETARYHLALNLGNAGELEESFRQYERLLALRPDHPKYLCDFSTVALQRNELARALDAASRAVRAAPSNPRNLNALGNVYMRMNEPTRAAEYYREAVRLQPTNAAYMHNLGRAHLVGKNPKLAVQIFTEVLRLKPDSARAYNDRGMAHHQMNEIVQALADYQAAVKFDPKFTQSHYNLASIYAVEDDPRFADRFKALDHAQAAVRLSEGKNALYLMCLADAWIANRRYDRAIDAARQAMALAPNDANRAKLAKVEERAGQGFNGRIVNRPESDPNALKDLDWPPRDINKK